jgi:hypothetical protein
VLTSCALCPIVRGARFAVPGSTDQGVTLDMVIKAHGDAPGHFDVPQINVPLGGCFGDVPRGSRGDALR